MNQGILTRVTQIVKEKCDGEGSGHDFAHVMRVYHHALAIAQEQGQVDLLIVGLGALLHDVADHKFGHTDLDRQRIIEGILEPLNVEEEVIRAVVYIANHISFKDGTMKDPLHGMEAKIVQDADRLDALGAIGIARTFAYGGFAGRPMYSPENGRGYEDGLDSISHFYKKLLKLKDRMHTQTGKKMAEVRHDRLLNFLELFYDEWDAVEPVVL